LDGPKEAIAVADVPEARGPEVLLLGTLGPRQCDIDTLVRTRQAKARPLLFVDEAGPCGYWLYRYLTETKLRGWVVAPSLVPTQAGDRVQTARRDAVQLARLTRAGDLTPVYVPAVEDEAIRDPARAREEAIRDLKAAKNRLQAFLQRQAIRDVGCAHGGPAHRRWLREVVGPTPAPPLVCQASVRAVAERHAGRQRLEAARQDSVQDWRRYPVVQARPALRGVQCTGAVTRIAALGDLTRCQHPRQRMSYLGLTPSAYARGARRRQGAMTKAGHTCARRALLEGAGAYR
jgi:transposase